MLFSSPEPNSPTSFCLSDCGYHFFCDIEKVMELPSRIGMRINYACQGLKTSHSMGSESTGY